MKRKTDQRPEKKEPKSNKDNDNDDDSNIISNANIKHVSGNLNADDLYALPNKRTTATTNIPKENKVYEIASDEEKDECDNKNSSDSSEDKDANKDLPFGWEKHEDNDGPYYWHIKSGTIQREPPVWPKEQITELKTPSSGINQSPSLVHMRATASLAKYNQHIQNTGNGFNGRSQVIW